MVAIVIGSLESLRYILKTGFDALLRNIQTETRQLVFYNKKSCPSVYFIIFE